MKNIVLKSTLLSAVATIIIFFAYKAFLSSKLSKKDAAQSFNVKYNISIAGNSNKEDALAQVKKRCEGSNYKFDFTPIGSDNLSVQFYKVRDTSSLTKLLFTTSAVEFRSTYTFAELANELKMFNSLAISEYQSTNKLDKEQIDSSKASEINAGSNKSNKSFLDLKTPYNATTTANLCYVNAKDTGKIYESLSKYRSVFPASVEFKYGAADSYTQKNADQKLCILYAVKNDSSEILPGGKNIKEARLDFDERATPCIGIHFTPDAAKKWADLTERNINKPIAIIINNEVMTAPLVNTSITTGNAQISGAFTTAEAQLLATQLNIGKSFSPVTTSLLQVHYEPATDQVSSYSKMALVLAASFIILFGLFFLVFKFLAPVKS